MGKIAELFKSRKFWAALGAIMALVASGLQGLVGWTEVVIGAVGIVMAWITGQSRVDASQ